MMKRANGTSNNSPKNSSPTHSNKQTTTNESSLLHNRQNRNAWSFLIFGFVMGALFNTLLHGQQSPVCLPMSEKGASNNNNNKHHQQQRQLQQQQWASLSSSFPPPREPPTDRTLEKELAALDMWQMQSIATASSGGALCNSPDKTLTQKCKAINLEVGEKLKQDAASSSFLTRKVSGYNFKDFAMVVGGDMITINQLSTGYEKIFQGLKLHSASTFMGVSNQQDPLDAVAIGDLLWRVQPDLVIELGTSGGGSAFYYSQIMERYNPSARLLTIDPAAGKNDGRPLTQWNDYQVKVHCPFCQHSTTMKEWRRDDTGRIRFHHGFPDSPEALSIARAAAAEAKTVLIIEDSNHLFEVVNANINAYHELVTPGSYFLVQDTRLGGPHKAVQKFLESKNGACFDIDKRWEYFIFSQHFDGFLRKRENCASTTTASS